MVTRMDKSLPVKLPIAVCSLLISLCGTCNITIFGNHQGQQSDLLRPHAVVHASKLPVHEIQKGVGGVQEEQRWTNSSEDEPGSHPGHHHENDDVEKMDVESQDVESERSWTASDGHDNSDGQKSWTASDDGSSESVGRARKRGPERFVETAQIHSKDQSTPLTSQSTGPEERRRRTDYPEGPDISKHRQRTIAFPRRGSKRTSNTKVIAEGNPRERKRGPRAEKKTRVCQKKETDRDSSRREFQGRAPPRQTPRAHRARNKEFPRSRSRYDSKRVNRGSFFRGRDDRGDDTVKHRRKIYAKDDRRNGRREKPRRDSSKKRDWRDTQGSDKSQRHPHSAVLSHCPPRQTKNVISTDPRQGFDNIIKGSTRRSQGHGYPMCRPQVPARPTVTPQFHYTGGYGEPQGAQLRPDRFVPGGAMTFPPVQTKLPQRRSFGQTRFLPAPPVTSTMTYVAPQALNFHAWAQALTKFLKSLGYDRDLKDNGFPTAAELRGFMSEEDKKGLSKSRKSAESPDYSEFLRNFDGKTKKTPGPRLLYKTFGGKRKRAPRAKGYNRHKYGFRYTHVKEILLANRLAQEMLTKYDELAIDLEGTGFGFRGEKTKVSMIQVTGAGPHMANKKSRAPRLSKKEGKQEVLTVLW